MALVNHAKREINAKIVFCGPSGAGKATLIKAICSRLPADTRGQLRSMSFQQDKMLFFDFTHPESGDLDKYSLRLHLYTLTGDISQDSAWKMVLKGVDGLAFVADPDPARQAANRHAFAQMQVALHANGKRLEELPSVLVCPKQDLPDVIPMDRISSALSENGLTPFPVESLSGKSVLDPLCEILSGMVKNLEQLGLALHPGVMGLCNLVPGRVPPTPAAVEAVQQKPVQSLLDISSESETDSPVLTFEGTPELAPDGTLTINIVANCCGRSTRSSLKIALTNGI